VRLRNDEAALQQAEAAVTVDAGEASLVHDEPRMSFEDKAGQVER